MRIITPILLILLLSGCGRAVFVHYEEPNSEYERGMAYCDTKPSEDFKNLCKFHWKQAYAEKYSIAWADYPF